MSFTKVSTLSDLAEQQPVRVVVDGHPVVLVRLGETVYAVSAVCSHENASLADGFVDEATIECPRHGALFDLRSGQALTLPATQPIPTYDVVVEGTDVLVSTGSELQGVHHG